MQLHEISNILKALSDNSRLQILTTLIDKPQYVEEIAQRINLAVSTTSFHLKKLENAGLVSKEKKQYYYIYSANIEMLDMPLRELLVFENDDKLNQEKRIDSYKTKVLKTFYKNKRLTKLPVQFKKKMIVFEPILNQFDTEKVYSEKEVDEIINVFFDDHCEIRRFFIDNNFMERNDGNYKLLKNIDDEKIVSDLETLKNSKRNRKTEKMQDRKKELKSEYKNAEFKAGIFKITNTINGKVFLGKGQDLDKIFTRHMFQLKVNSHVNPEMQKDFKSYGAEVFKFEILELANKKKILNLPQYLKDKLHEWKEHLTEMEIELYN